MLSIALALYVHAFWPLCVLLAVAAWRWGGGTEQRASWAFVTAMTAAKLAPRLANSMYSSVEWGVALLDGLLLLWFLSLSLRDPKSWLIAVTALQLLSASAHLARMVDWNMTALAYAILMGTGGYPILLLLAAGIVANTRQQARISRRARG